MGTEAISESTAEQIERELTMEYGLLVAYKAAGPLTTIIGAGFDVARAFGAPVPSGAQFIQNTSTMLPLLPVKGLPRGLVFLPAGAVSPYQRVQRMAHEAKHSDQYLHPEPGEHALMWGARYVIDQRFRASQEAGGYLTNFAIDWALGASVEDIADRDAAALTSFAHAVTNTYALTADDEQLILSLCELELASIFEGVVRCRVARRVIARLAQLQPGCLTDQARALGLMIRGEVER